MTQRRTPWRYTLLAVSVGLALSGNCRAVDYEITDNDDVQNLTLEPDAPQSDYEYSLTGTLSQNREKTLTITGPQPEGEIKNPLSISLESLVINNDARLSLLINTDINSSSGTGLYISERSGSAGPATYAEFNGNITSINNYMIPATSGIYVWGLRSLSTGEDSQIDVQASASRPVGINITSITEYTGQGKIHVSGSGVNGGSTGILINAQELPFTMFLSESSDIQVESTGAGNAAYGVKLGQTGTSEDITQFGRIEVNSQSGAIGIISDASTVNTSTIRHGENGLITVDAPLYAYGIAVNSADEVSLTSAGDITVNSGMAQGILVTDSAKVGITHSGKMNITSQNSGAGIFLQQGRETSDISVKNSGIINLVNEGIGIYIDSPGKNGGTLEITNENTGQILGGKGAENAGVFVNTPFNGASLNNEGSIAGANNIAVKVQGAGLAIANSGILQGTIMAVQSDGAGEQATLPEIALNNSGTWRLVADAPDSHLTGGIVNTGTLVFGNNDSGSAGNHTVNVGSKGLTNSGTIHLSADADTVGNQVTIDGDYQSTGGKIIFNSELHGDEHSRTDHLHITGDVLEGDTKVTVNNIGGKGEQTIEGINLITLAGTATGTFTQDGRVVAGAYEYFLHPVDGGWALKSSTTPPGPGPDDPDEPVDPDNPPPVPPQPGPVDPDNPQPGPDEPVPPVPPQPQPEPPAPPAPPQPQPPAPVKPVIRPEAIAYAQNLRLANTLFVTREAQRQGVGEYSDPLSGERRTSSLWLTQLGGHTTAEDSSGQLRSQANRYTVQLGGTLQEWQTPAGKFALGAMAGYGYAHGNSHSVLTGYHTRSSVSGYNTGLYGTWRENDGHLPGGYVSSVLQYSWLDNSVNGEGLAAEDYRSRGATVSLEGGYDVAVWQSGEKAGDALYLRPHAQVVWMGVKADDHREKNGTLVSQHGDGNVLSRTGGRLWLDKQVTETQRLESYVEANWLHNTRDFCASMDRVADCQAGNRNQGEVVLGVKGQVNPWVDVTVQAAGQFGEQGSRDLSGLLDVAVKF